MQRKNLNGVTKKQLMTGCIALAAAVIIGGTALWQKPGQEPEFPSYTDPVAEISIEEEEPPLASKPKSSTKTSKKTKTTKKKVKLKKASKKSYTKKLPTTKKTSTKNQEKKDVEVKTETTVTTATTEKYTKKSKIKVVTKKVTTVTKTTTTTKVGEGPDAVTSSGDAEEKGRYEVDVAKAAPMMDSRVISAYKKLGFKVYVDSSVNYSGYFDARTRVIILQKEGSTIYHELGHFLAFIAGNADRTSDFQSVFSEEKGSFSGVNKAYATQNSSEYFAESAKDYMLAKASLSSSRPKTCTAIEQALDKVTEGQISKIQMIYGAFWK